MISEKTLNSLMEDLTVIYETRPTIGLIDYTIHQYTIHHERLIRCHFSGFGSLAATVLTEILSRYPESLIWCVQPSGSRYTNVEVDIFGA
jgi:hypothetical protein